MKWHPDRNPGDNSSEVRFKEINEAYEILKDPDKRAAYDRFGHAAFEHAGPGAAGGFGDVASAFADIFDDLFGMGGGRRGRGGGRERGADLRYNMEITLEEAYSGKNAQVRIPTSVTCEACSGSGAKSGTRPKACPTCGGQGRIRHAQGFFTLERTCPACQGRGQVIDNPCPSCSGSGRVTRERFALGQHSLRGRGRHPHQACGRRRSGRAQRACRRPLYFSRHRRPSVLPPRGRRFALSGADLNGACRAGRLRSRCRPSKAITAGSKVPEGTQSGRRFRLQGKGMPVLRSKQCGDMYVQVLVETPQKLSKQQRELLNEFERLSSKETQPETAGILRQSEGVLGSFRRCLTNCRLTPARVAFTDLGLKSPVIA
jgi:molecular chaperone DnaJ